MAERHNWTPDEVNSLPVDFFEEYRIKMRADSDRQALIKKQKERERA